MQKRSEGIAQASAHTGPDSAERSISAAEKNEPQTEICSNLLESEAQNVKLFSTELTASQDKAKNVYWNTYQKL